MKYGYTIFYVAEVTKTIRFYERAFGFITKFITPENDYGELISGETVIAFAAFKLVDNNFSNKKGIYSSGFTPSMNISFVTNNVDVAYRKAVAAGAEAIASVTQKTWGQKVAYVKDINGIIIELCTPVNA